MRAGVRLGIDVGSVRVGVATCDPDAILATPLQTVPRRADPPDDDEDLVRLSALVRDHAPIEVVVGLPRSLSGEEGPAARAVREYARRLRVAVNPVPVRLVDERMTTVDAHRNLHASGRRGREHRAVVDQAAAVLILQNALDAERASGHPPGETVPGRKPRHRSARAPEKEGPRP